MDKLEQIMQKQLELQKRLGTDFSNMTPEARAEFMRNHRGYLADELAEALYEMPHYKLWKDYSKMSNEAEAIQWQKVRMELADCLHFFVNLLLCAGMSASEVYEMYMAKNKENHRRQDAGYDADTSYRDQSVEEVMDADSFCTVKLGDDYVNSSDFIAIINDASGDTHLYYDTDAITLGQAIQMLSVRFEELMASYPEETRKEILEVLANG